MYKPLEINIVVLDVKDIVCTSVIGDNGEKDIFDDDNSF